MCSWLGLLRHPHKDRVDQDSAQRLAILASNEFLVWSLSYEDVQSILEDKSVDQFDLFLGMPKEKLEAFLEKFNARSLMELKSRSSFYWLVEWLSQPCFSAWNSFASAFVFGGFLKACSTPSSNEAFYQEFELPDYAQTQLGNLWLSGDKKGCLKGIVMGESWQRFHLGWIVDKSAIKSGNMHQLAGHCVFDDSSELTDSDLDKQQWNGFLRMINLLQFQSLSCFFTIKGIANSLYSGLASNKTTTEDSGDAWDELLADAVSDEERALIVLLSSLGVEIPILGYELENEEGEVLAEAFLAWTNQKIAVLFDDVLEDQSVFTAMGWTVFTSPALQEDSSAFVNLFKK
ncbi:hypothetical protein [Methylomarinum vadi]|uniref:hypothetical protein n=1 Tax=Methylomarinum vadi TaxID=438855 RepID=UPI0004DFCC01|nr:hypothetical protein [Methylomarinum vadi]